MKAKEQKTGRTVRVKPEYVERIEKIATQKKWSFNFAANEIISKGISK